MDTKLKNTKTNGTFVLSAGWIIFLTLMIVIYTECTATMVSGEFVLEAALVGSVYLLLLLIGTIFYLKKHKLSDFIRESKIDECQLEFIILGILFVICGVFLLLPWCHPANWLPNDAFFSLLLYFNGCILGAILLYVQIILLIRKKVLGLFAKTSLIAKIVKQYRNRTSIEQRIKNYHRLIAILICGGLGMVILLNLIAVNTGGVFGIEIYSMLICGLIAISAICYFTQCNMWKDTGKLVQMIHELNCGVESMDMEPISERAILYETACELRNIQHTMEENVESRMQSERMKVDLITNVSHDLKTPLTSMVGYTELLKKEELSPVARDYVDVIAGKQEKLAKMIQDIFELSKATSRSEQMNMQVLDMNRLVEQIMTDMEDICTKCGFTYVKRLAEEPLLFQGDNNKMYRVVQNILENTTKYSMAGTRVFVETTVKDGMVRLQVKNTASYEMNFTAEEIRERFARGDKARTSEGHGLGLAIAESLLENMNGSMKIEIDGDVFKVLIELKQLECG